MRLLTPLILAALPGLATAQTAPAVGDPGVTLSALLAEGYEIKAMHYLPSGLLFTLQRGAQAYVCETTVNGQSKLCLALQ